MFLPVLTRRIGVHS